ncbi:MAG: hypothetical protein IJ833_03975 [Lachnospiraceae bacterium]|nr:hypothetical protein [Lachnospiraceae bacterium]
MIRKNRAEKPQSIHKAGLSGGILLTESLLIGWMLVIWLAEAAHLCALVFGWSFSMCEKLFIGEMSVFLAAVVVLLLVKRHQEHKSVSRRKEREKVKAHRKMGDRQKGIAQQVMGFLFAVLVLLQIILLLMERKSYMVGDATTETVNTILSTDTIYQMNPFTGRAYTEGIPLRLRILCLPTLYAFLCDIFKIPAYLMTWTIAPMITLLLGYVAFDMVGQALLVKEKRRLFLLLVAVVLTVGNYAVGMDGFGAQYAGGSGTTIRALILLPCALAAMLRRKWWMAGMCVVTEGCLVWTLYGMGMCLMLAVGMLCVQAATEGVRRWKRKSWQKSDDGSTRQSDLRKEDKA